MPRLTMPPPGTAGGIEAEELSSRASGTEPVSVTCIDYSPEQVSVQEVTDIPAFLARHRPSWSRVRWINVDGLEQMEVIRALAEKYQLHPLAVEDVLHTVQPPKAEDYPASGDLPGRLFVVARSIEERDGQLYSDQISLFLGRTTLLTFQETHADDLAAVRQRILTPGSRLRQNDASFLLYVLLDAIVDHFFPVLERYSERLEDVEEELLARPSQATLQRIQAIEARAAARAAHRLADARADRPAAAGEARVPLGDDPDVLPRRLRPLRADHRPGRDLSRDRSGLAETYMSVVSNRMNEIMKVLTVIGTIFIPLTFLAGVYGMNMPIPENGSPLAYPLFWLACAGVAGGMLLWFRHRGWL